MSMAKTLSNWRDYVMMAGVAILLAYLGWHLLSGRFGLLAYFTLAQKERQLDRELAGLLQDNAKLSQQVNLLRSDQLDPDRLDELARKMLHLAHPDDVIIKLPPNN